MKRPTISLAALGTFLAFWLLKRIYPPLYPWFTSLPDGVRKSHPFVDMRDILQAGACWRQGVDVYHPSACLHGGIFNYSPFLLRAAYLPVGPGDTLLAGLLLALAFFASLGLLPRPASRREFYLRLAATLSPTSFYAVEQGNFDLAIFVLAALGCLAIATSRRLAFIGHLVFMLAAAMKFYPVAALILLLRGSARTVLAAATAGLVATLLFLALYANGVAAALATIPSSPPFRATFGRIDLPWGLNLLHIITSRQLNHWLGLGLFTNHPLVTSISLLLAAAALTASFRLRHAYTTALKTLDPARATFLIASAAILVFCFYAAQNVVYRAIFLLPILPGLCALAGRRPRLQLLLAAILLLLWEAAIRAALGLASPANPAGTGFWLLRETLWWWVVIELGALVLAFVTIETPRLARESRALWRAKIDGPGRKP